MKKRKLLGTIATFLMTAPLLVGLAGANAIVVNAAEGGVITKPDTINFTIHKKVWDENSDLPSAKPNSGLIMSDFGGTGLAGVDFTLYDVTDIYYSALKDDPRTEPVETEGLSSEDALKAIQESWDEAWVTKHADKIETVTTDADGLAKFENVETTQTEQIENTMEKTTRDKVLLFVETYSPADVSIIATPMVILLPVMMPNTTDKDADGSWKGTFLNTFNNDVQLYAKNQQQTPTKKIVDPRNVSEVIVKDGEGQDKTISLIDLEKGEKLSYEITSPIPYFIRDTTIELNEHNEPIKDENGNEIIRPVITNFTITDVPTKNLKYVNNPEEDVLVITNSTDGTKLVKDTDYTLTEDADGGFTVKILTEKIDGSPNIDTLNKMTAGGTLILSYKMLLTAEVTADMLHENKATISIGRNDTSDYNEEVFPPEKIVTGGRKFLKNDGSTKDELLGAKFVLWNSDKSQYAVFHKPNTDVTQPDIAMADYASDATSIIWKDKGASESPAPDATKFTATDINGACSFEVVGLRYGDYYMQETEAPDGYALPNGDNAYTPFTVAYGSYESQLIEIETPDLVTISNTRKGTLPSTGGVGIIAFVVIGLLMMTGAYLWFRNSKRTSKI